MTPFALRAGAFLLSAAALFSLAPPVSAGSIPLDVWLEFAVTDAGIPATGCDPADVAGPICTPSSGAPTQFLDAPPWTFVAPAAANVVVTDAFESTEQFEVFDFGASLGLTSPPAAALLVDCGDDPVVCLGTGGISHGLFAVGPGNHSLTIVPTLSQGGVGYFIVTVAVPEPGALALLVIGLAGIALQVRKAR